METQEGLKMINIRSRIFCVPFLITLLAVFGCQKRAVDIPPKAPRPVTVMTLNISTPASSYNVTGSVKSWKTEQIGFEVAGRIQWVMEPGKNIEGQVRDTKGELIKQGTPLARIDPSRYEVAVESDKAALDVARLDKEVIEIQITDSLPSDIKSAESDVELARVDFERMKTLKSQNAVSETEFESAANQLQTQRSRLASLQSSLKQASAEVKAAEARVKSAEQSYRDAQRDLANTTLYASYQGQISAVDVVPGSVVSAGSPILTLQMMTPIKVEIEVSAEQSRELQRRRQVPVSFSMSDGTINEQKGMVYLVDPSADASTRTFTVTLLLTNEQNRTPLSEKQKGRPVARSQDVWPLKISQIIGGQTGLLMVEEGAIESDGDESFVWLIKDVRFGDTMPELVKVEKRKVTPGTLRLPFLGNWVFQQITFDDNSIDSESLLAGKLEFPDIEPSEWDGESVVLDSGQQWMLRPGDLVNVNLNPELSRPGLFVPVEAIYEDVGETFVFVADQGSARKIQVKAILPTKLDTGSLTRIEPIEESSSTLR